MSAARTIIAAALLIAADIAAAPLLAAEIPPGERRSGFSFMS